MNTTSQFADVWNELLPRQLVAGLDATPFLTRCRQGRASRAELEVFLVQQYHYSRHFTRYLCALLSNMTNEADRLALTDNLFEEMGLGDAGQIPHSKLYRDMLDALQLDPANHPPLPETQALVATMIRLSADPDPMRGLGALCLGAEAIVPHLYTQILHGLLRAGFAERQLEFFPLHIAGDDEHALTMKRIIDRELAASPSAQTALREAARESIGKRRAFFEAIGRLATADHAPALREVADVV